MTTQIDDQFTDWLQSAFTLSELTAMSAEQREVMRDTFLVGFITGHTGAVADPVGEMTIYHREAGTEIAKTKARHCVQEAIIIKRAEN